LATISYDWRIRQVMAERGLFMTSDLIAPLRQRNVVLSNAQIYRIVTTKPKRINVDVLMAICDVLECNPADLLVNTLLPGSKKFVASASGTPAVGSLRPIKSKSPFPESD